MNRLLLCTVLVQLYGICLSEENSIGNEIADGCRMKVCRHVEAEECGVCHSLFMKECHIQMEYSYKPIKINDCKESICGASGYKRECRTKYYTECSTDMVYHNMVEDYPVCGVSKHKKCTESGDCMMVPVMKCKIEKRTIRKAKPESKCRRVPTQICKKKKCEKRRCFERVVMSKEMVPREKCEYKEKRVCQEVEGSTCRPVTRQECEYKFTGKPCQHDQMMKQADHRQSAFSP